MQSIYKGVLMVSRDSYYQTFCLTKSTKLTSRLLTQGFFFRKVVGSRFAWATRNVHITALNDSKYVGMSLYNVVLLSTTTAVVSYFLQDQHERSYILTSIFILLCVTITLCLVFVPKVREVLRDPYSRAKPQRAVFSSVTTTKSTIDETSDKRIWNHRHHSHQLTLRLKQLTIQNATLRSNAIKVAIYKPTTFFRFTHSSFLVR